MKVPRFLKFLMAFCVCVALIRAAIGAGEISLYSMLLDLQRFDFEFDGIRNIVEFFSSGDFLDTFVKWDSSLTGVDGFFINIRNVVTSFFVTTGTVLSVVVRGLWSTIVHIISLFGDLFSLALRLLGYM